MKQHKLLIQSTGKGLYAITDKVKALLEDLPQTGLLHLFLQHTSASLLIQENYDSTAKADLETFFDRLAPEGEDWHQHTLEGPDDTTSHLKAALTQSSLSIPIVEGELGLGTWQGIYLFEHRKASHQRQIIVTVF